MRLKGMKLNDTFLKGSIKKKGKGKSYGRVVWRGQSIHNRRFNAGNASSSVTPQVPRCCILCGNGEKLNDNEDLHSSFELEDDCDGPDGLFRISSLQEKLLSLSQEEQTEALSRAVSKRQKLGESHSIDSVSFLLDRTRSDVLVCRKHYMSIFHSLQRQPRFPCSICQRPTIHKYLQPVMSLGPSSDELSFVITDLISVLLQSEISKGNSTSQLAPHTALGNEYQDEGTKEQMKLGDLETEEDELDENLVQRAKEIYSKRLKLCSRCNISIKRKLNAKVEMKSEDFPNGIMEAVNNEYEEKLLGNEGLGKTAHLLDMYKAYLERVSVYLSLKSSNTKNCEVRTRIATSCRTFWREIHEHSRLCVLKNISFGGRRGSLAASFDTVSMTLSENSPNDSTAQFYSSSAFRSLKEHFRFLCKRYREMNVTDEDNQTEFDIIAEIKAIPSLLWSYKYCLLESHRERMCRLLYLKEKGGEISELPFPFGSNEEVTLQQLHSLRRASFRKVMRVLSIIQFECFTKDARCVGPIVWAYSSGVSAKGGDALLGISNSLGLSVHPNTMNNFKDRAMKKRIESDPPSRIIQGSFCAFAHDNIDADLHKTTMADGYRSKSFHGTISVAQQSGVVPIISTIERYRPLPESIQKGSDMIGNYKDHVRAAQSLMMGAVAAFGENLLSPDSENGTTLGYLMKLFLKGHCSGNPRVVENLWFYNLPSNNTETCREVLQDYMRASLPRSGEESPDYIIAVADMPLYDRCWNLLYGGVSAGKRNEEFDSIVPVPGGLHLRDMGLFDVAKRLCYHSFMDRLVPYSGLTEGAASRFLSSKDPKTNHRIFGQVACATIRRIVDCLLETGDLDTQNLPNFTAGSTAKNLDQVINELKTWGTGRDRGARNAYEQTYLELNGEYPGLKLFQIGSNILNAAESRAERVGEHQFKHFNTVLNVLLPVQVWTNLSANFYGETFSPRSVFHWQN